MVITHLTYINQRNCLDRQLTNCDTQKNAGTVGLMGMMSKTAVKKSHYIQLIIKAF